MQAKTSGVLSAVMAALLFTGAAVATSSDSSREPAQTVLRGYARAYAADYTSYLNAGSTLYPGDSLWSPNHLYRITQQTDGNLVLYSEPGNKPFWSSGTSGHPNSVSQFQGDGNLVVYATGHIAIWASGSSGHPNSVLFMQNDANLVIRAPGNVPVWATNAQNIAGCADGSRSQASQYDSSHQYYVPVPSVDWSERPIVGAIGNTQSYGIQLEYNPAHRCAWAEGYGDTLDSTWVDRSSDGGATWAAGSHLGTSSPGIGKQDSYTGAYNDSYPYVMRACEESDDNTIRCTAWF